MTMFFGQKLQQPLEVALGVGAGFFRIPAASGVRAAWCFGYLYNGGNGSVSCRSSNSWVSPANWGGSLGATGTIMGLVFKNHCTV